MVRWLLRNEVLRSARIMITARRIWDFICFPTMPLHTLQVRFSKSLFVYPDHLWQEASLTQSMLEAR
ncbi:hypothetical protein WG66_000713 [Moniliophthora roreri]|nr:hypothetical protein WG66_000713 [Moniliophthora roreri]